MSIACVACMGTGVGQGQGAAPVGQLLPLCLMCDGAGAILPHTINPPFRAIWLVGERYVVKMTVPKVRGVVELDLEWSPAMPPARGKKKLKPGEMQQYRDGRDQALRVLNFEMGGTFELIEAGDRH